MRRSFSRGFFILLIVASMALPASAAPQHDDPDSRVGFLARIVQLVKRFVPLDLTDINFPKP